MPTTINSPSSYTARLISSPLSSSDAAGASQNGARPGLLGRPRRCGINNSHKQTPTLPGPREQLLYPTTLVEPRSPRSRGTPASQGQRVPPTAACTPPDPCHLRDQRLN